MKTAFLILFAITGLLGCSKSRTDISQGLTANTDTTTKVTNKTTLQYLALGDSYTIGQSVDLAQSFPYQLKTSLMQQGYTVADPKIIAVTGWTTTNLIDAIAQANLTQKYDFVTLLIGVNNQFQGKSQTQYRAEFVQLLNTAIAFANGNKKRVFVLSIPDYSVTPFAQYSDKAKTASEIDQFNDINYYESTNAGVNYLNITGISRQAATDLTLIAVDGLHPSATMYSLWVTWLAPMVVNNLK
jgi:lysophospholipase L1-like esterase